MFTFYNTLFFFSCGQHGKIVIFRVSVPAKSNLMVNFVSLSLLLDKNKSDGRYSVILFCPLVSFYLLFISKALFPETIKKSQPHSPSESVVYPENGGHATLSRSTLVSRNECKASRLYICRKITEPFILIRQKLKLSDTRKKNGRMYVHFCLKLPDSIQPVSAKFPL